MPQGLPVSRLINVSVNLSPLAAQFANFDTLLVLGDSDVIDVAERIRSYSSITEVAADFGTTAPEYKAAALFFSQSPQPTQLYLGRWAKAASHGLLKGGPVSTANKLIGHWTSITNGSLRVTVDGGAVQNLAALNFSAATNLNGVAAIITAALTGATCTWDGTRFRIISSSTGPSSTVSAASSTGSGTDISDDLFLTTALLTGLVAGIAAETALTAVTILDDISTQWYALMFAASAITDNDHAAVAGYIEATDHIYGVSSIDAAALDSLTTSDIGSVLKAAGYRRSLVHWHSSNAYAVASLFGRELTVNFEENNSVITLMYKQEPGVTADTLTTTQADTLITKRYNFFVNYDNATAILQNGVMSGSAFIDEIHGTDWLRNAIQTNVYNLLYTARTKIPQTDDGVHQIVSVIESTCAGAVANGLVAPGKWNSGGFGALRMGDYLAKGYYVYAQPLFEQAQASREARHAPPIQVAVKLAGAVHDADISINVNR